nr:PREDICTED: putative F-box protein At4g38870 [Musa acuminata subsp. malaccensis]
MSEAPASNNNMEKTSSELPPDLFMEILSWIPASALLKLRCVRKHWYSMTTDPVFIRFHLQRQQLLPQVTSILTFHRHFTNVRSLLSRLDVVDAPWVAKHVAVWHSRPLLVMSPPCHGLFCLYHIYMELDVCLYNPATCKSFSLPHNFTSVNIILSDFCLGYHPGSRQYKVIHTFCTRSTSLAMEALTVGGSTWRKVEVSSALAMLTLLNWGRPSATGTMYWLAQNNVLEDIILSLDLDNERLTQVPFPDIKRQHERGNNSLIEMEGTIHLAIHWFAMVDWMDIWMLQESGAHRVWIHRFHLHLCALPTGVRQVERVLRPPMPLLINQGKILIRDYRRLVYYDLVSKGLQHEEVFHACDDFIAFVIVESLVSF